MTERTRRTTIDLPDAMYRDLKARAFEEGISMRRYCIRAFAGSLRVEQPEYNVYAAAPNDPQFLDFDQYAAKAEAIWISGITLSGLTQKYHEFMVQCVRRGVSLRLLLLSPDLGVDSSILRAIQALISSGSEQSREVSSLVKDLQDSLDFLHKLNDLALSPGQVSVRAHQSVMGSGLTFLDPESPLGEARVNLYSYGRGTPAGRHPALYIRRDSSSAIAMYDLLFDHFNRIWQPANTIT